MRLWVTVVIAVLSLAIAARPAEAVQLEGWCTTGWTHQVAVTHSLHDYLGVGAMVYWIDGNEGISLVMRARMTVSPSLEFDLEQRALWRSGFTPYMVLHYHHLAIRGTSGGAWIGVMIPVG